MEFSLPGDELSLNEDVDSGFAEDAEAQSVDDSEFFVSK